MVTMTAMALEERRHDRIAVGFVQVLTQHRQGTIDVTLGLKSGQVQVLEREKPRLREHRGLFHLERELDVGAAALDDGTATIVAVAPKLRRPAFRLELARIGVLPAPRYRVRRRTYLVERPGLLGGKMVRRPLVADAGL